jgi:hypothetical protein
VNPYYHSLESLIKPKWLKFPSWAWAFLPTVIALSVGYRPIYEVGDDPIMERLVSVGLWGIPPQPHLYYQSSRLGWVLHQLYELCSFIPWYPTLQWLGLLGALWIATTTLIKQNHHPQSAFVIGTLLGCLWLPHLFCLQFTRVAVMVTIGAFIALWTKCWHRTPWQWILLCYATSVRSHAVLLTLLLLTMGTVLFNFKIFKSKILPILFIFLLVGIIHIDNNNIQPKTLPQINAFYQQNNAYSPVINYRRLNDDIINEMNWTINDFQLLMDWIPFPLDAPNFQLEKFTQIIENQNPSITQKLTRPILSFQWSAFTWFSTTFLLYNPLAWAYGHTGLIWLLFCRSGWRYYLGYSTLWLGLLVIGMIMIYSMKMVPRLWEPLCVIPPMILMMSTRDTNLKNHWIFTISIMVLGLYFLFLPHLKRGNSTTTIPQLALSESVNIVYTMEPNLWHQPFLEKPRRIEAPVVIYIGWLRQLYLAQVSTAPLIKNIHINLLEDGFYWKGDKWVPSIEKYYLEHYDLTVRGEKHEGLVKFSKVP